MKAQSILRVRADGLRELKVHFEQDMTEGVGINTHAFFTDEEMIIKIDSQSSNDIDYVCVTLTLKEAGFISKAYLKQVESKLIGHSNYHSPNGFGK